MKRVYICIGIFCAIIAVSIFSLFVLEKSNDELFSRIDEITELYEKGSDETSEKIKELEKFWRKYYIRISFVAQSSTLDDISYSVAKLSPMLDEDSDEFVSECKSIRYWAYLVYISQFPYLHSVF